ncbi:Rha family transcriptional regulator [Pseudomonas sp. MPFS]|uniref:Rha family transcriptional regulator n=1 Tax=Pseudomonas sp. MPFS TaxID=2795724 RepID=UPI001F140E0E|nr:Rha family transcriptional regulator [Pseudomonas sp. MPFS]UMZ14726.1 Rha family transcriptional regulator [Pseudomonas sp. MPFS]
MTITMTTKEIAELTGKQHKNVLRDADRIIEQLKEASSTAQGGGLKTELSSIGATEAEYMSAQNKPLRMLVLDKALTFTLITGYDSTLRYAVVARWIDLERAANPEFDGKAIVAIISDLQARVDLMAPVYAEHVRKGTTGRGYLIDEAARMVGLTGPVVRAWFLAHRVTRKEKVGPVTVNGQETRTTVNPRFLSEGFAKKGPSRSHSGHPDGFKLTAKGLEWLKEKAEEITSWDTARKSLKIHKDADGFVTSITGEGSQGLRLDQL